MRSRPARTPRPSPSPRTESPHRFKRSFRRTFDLAPCLTTCTAALPPRAVILRLSDQDAQELARRACPEPAERDLSVRRATAFHSTLRHPFPHRFKFFLLFPKKT